jgi:uncharacterized protein
VLLNFTTENFRSFGDEQTLNMVASSLKDHLGHCVPIPQTAKSALQIGAIYGANASGKSNLVKAMLFAQWMVTGQTTLARLNSNHFRFAKKRNPMSFEFRFLAGGTVFVYGFSVARDAIVQEWLDASTATGREANVYTRDEKGIHFSRLTSFGKDGASLRKALGALKLLGIRDDKLLLNMMTDLSSQHRGELLNKVIWWFTECLIVIQAQSEFHSLMDMLGGDDDFRRFCGAFLKNVGTGISDVTVERQKIDADKVPKPFLEQLQAPRGLDVTVNVGPGVQFELDSTEPSKVVRKNLTATHLVSGSDYPIPFQDESDGTQRCLNLLPALYHLTQASKVFVVDEIDRSLHPLLCHALVKLFLDACPGGYQQLIVTTHETHLLDTELLRRDEIWFMEKDHKQQSRLSSLGDRQVRKDLRIEKGYLHGRFGGIPFIGDTRKLIDLIQCPVNTVPNAKKTPA